MQVTVRHVAMVATIFLVPAVHAVSAQGTTITARPRATGDVRVEQIPGGSGTYSVVYGGENRAALGVTLSGNGKADTLGVLIFEVSADGPAAKAGIKENDRVVAINGVNLKVASADVDDPEMQGVGMRRLTRELGKAKPGDEVELRVATGGQTRTVRVKTISSADLNRMDTRGWLSTSRNDADKRPALGLSLGTSGNSRDTLGLFISSVVNNGPAEKAGVIEGERIASINGVDVRVPKEDAEDAMASSARVNRFTRELQKLAPGDKANLRVYSAGHYREVAVTAGKASEVNPGIRINVGGDGAMVYSLPRGAGGAASGSIAVPGRSPQFFRFDGGNGGVMMNGQPMMINESVDKAMQEFRTRMESMRDRLNDGRIEALPGRGVRIRTGTPSISAPLLPSRPMIRKVITTV